MRIAKKTDLGSRRIYQLLSRLCRKNSATNTEDFQGDESLEHKIKLNLFLAASRSWSIFLTLI